MERKMEADDEDEEEAEYFDFLLLDFRFREPYWGIFSSDMMGTNEKMKKPAQRV